ncbi:hypothetical protein EVAR_52660_1 [Eumeta japonica]|uniref:Uncharacterized protein n=1 Tax=Eumeta variegata TaxID=151549 RepID=A0A4C1YZ89_EUMVA|nr:hypothetical protein EVAR_52660_1 [Eumeta japonica]
MVTAAHGHTQPRGAALLVCWLGIRYPMVVDRGEEGESKGGTVVTALSTNHTLPGSILKAVKSLRTSEKTLKVCPRRCYPTGDCEHRQRLARPHGRLKVQVLFEIGRTRQVQNQLQNHFVELARFSRVYLLRAQFLTISMRAPQSGMLVKSLKTEISG